MNRETSSLRLYFVLMVTGGRLNYSLCLAMAVKVCCLYPVSITMSKPIAVGQTLDILNTDLLATFLH